MAVLGFLWGKRRCDTLVNARSPESRAHCVQGLSLAKSLILGLMLLLGCYSFRSRVVLARCVC